MAFQNLTARNVAALTVCQGRCKPSAESLLFAEVPPVLACYSMQKYEILIE